MSDQTQSNVRISLTEMGLSLAPAGEGEAERHLAELRTHHPRRPAESRALSMPRIRRIGRWLSRQLERLSIAGEAMRLSFESPSGRIGWWFARLRLLRRPTIGRATIFALVLFALVALVGVVSLPFPDKEVSQVVAGLFLGTTLTAAIVATWGDLVRFPYHARRVRRRIVKTPWCVLPTTAGVRWRELMGREEAPPMVPRRELYDELLPGILDRSRRDIQMLVGDPGSGKTTALVDISHLLARIGFVPVVVSLGNEFSGDLAELAKERFRTHAAVLLGEARVDGVWEWLRTHRRAVVLVDDLDRIAPDGERGFMVRQGLNELATEGLPAVVTTRPSGIPAGLAASAINLESLDEAAAIEHVLRAARKEHGAATRQLRSPEVRGSVTLWIREGRFAEVPFYLELLARLVAAGRCEELAPPRTLASDLEAHHRVRLKADGRCEWNPLWVRFRLLERFYDQVAEGRVRRWLGIESRERRRCLEALSEAALATLAAPSLEPLPECGDGGDGRLRTEIEDFLDPDDRYRYDSKTGERQMVSAHEVVDTAERLYMLDRDPQGKLLFKHRILQAYLAGRCLAGKLSTQPAEAVPEDDLEQKERREGPLDWLGALLSPRHPDRLTARMALTFAALFASTHRGRAGRGDGAVGIDRLLQRLLAEASSRIDPREFASEEEKRDWEARRLGRRLDPRKSFDPESFRVDPDDGLAILTTAAEIADATGWLSRPPGAGAGSGDTMTAILRGIERASGATRWTKVNAIAVLATLSAGVGGEEPSREQQREQWTRLWEFARDPDETVRREASAAMADDAFSAYRALEPGVSTLLARAALKSARDRPIDTLDGLRRQGDGDTSSGGAAAEGLAAYGIETEKEEVDSLCALGWMLPAIVSGLREQPLSMVERGFSQPSLREDGTAIDGAGGDADIVNRARQALERLVTLAFQRKFPELEASVARGFKSDAMRHLEDPEQAKAPGVVDSNRQLVSDVCIDNAHYWYARMVLHQALALYTVAGSSPQVALDTYGRLLYRSAEPHPFVSSAALQARRAVRRHLIKSPRWSAFVWSDEGEAVSRRQAQMNPTAGQLVGDVTLLLNLRQSAPGDRLAQSARTSRLPSCLSRSRDRLEILGAGCAKECGCELCPLAEAPVDEPDGKRTISRAFCRGQQKVARRHKPPWQKRIRKKALREFWSEMERRART